MLLTDAPAPFAEAYARLQAAQSDTSFDTTAHRNGLAEAEKQRDRRTNIKRRLPKAY